MIIIATWVIILDH